MYAFSKSPSWQSGRFSPQPRALIGTDELPLFWELSISRLSAEHRTKSWPAVQRVFINACLKTNHGGFNNQKLGFDSNSRFLSWLTPANFNKENIAQVQQRRSVEISTNQKWEKSIHQPVRNRRQNSRQQMWRRVSPDTPAPSDGPNKFEQGNSELHKAKTRKSQKQKSDVVKWMPRWKHLESGRNRSN